MCPCQPLQANLPDGPSGPSIPGFGQPFAMKTPDLAKELEPFPENLLELLEKLELLLPPGKLKPQLSKNFGKDIFDGIMKLLDQLMPFLMLYKFFLPILKLIICIIEVLCAIPNPFKLVKALVKLFRDCIPQFLSLFPIFALIILIISLILLLIALIQYLIQKVINLVLLIVKNIKMLKKAFETANEKGILAILKKIGAVLCFFQNALVLLAIFTTIIQSIKEMLGLLFALPPCDDDADCCTTDVCPAIVKSEYTRTTGVFTYYNKVIKETNILNIYTATDTIREETWQLYDDQQLLLQKFINIVDAADVTPNSGEPKPIFFPTDSTYSYETPAKQAPYTVDLRFFYNPAQWGKVGQPRFIRIKDCIVLTVPKTYLVTYNGSIFNTQSGTLSLSGGTAYEDDGVTKIENIQYGLNSLLSINQIIADNAPNNTKIFSNVEYTFKPNIPVLLSKNLVTAGCAPDLAVNKAFVNNAFAGDINMKLQLVNNTALPDTAAAQSCIIQALSTFENNITEEGAADLQSTIISCLNKLQDECFSALYDLISAGVDSCASKFTLSPSIQFTTQPIQVSVDLKDRNEISLASGLPEEVAVRLAENIKAHLSFGEISKFIYDGNNLFNANITSSLPGTGTIMVSFDDSIFCTNIIPTDTTVNPSRDLQELTYQFIYAPVAAPVAEGDTSDGQPRRDVADLSNTDNSREGA